jgi:acyl-CoA thioesterase
MNLHPLDKALSLERLDEGVWRGAPDPAFANMAGPFGGTTAAILLNSVLLDERRLADPIALTVNFCAAIADEPFVIETKLQRGGRTTQHWSAELKQQGAVAATASVVCGMRKTVWTHQQSRPPAAPSPDGLPLSLTALRPEWTRRYTMRVVEGGLDDFPRSDGAIRNARSLVWLQDEPPRPLDFLSLTALSDAFFVRIMVARGTWQPMATVTMTTYFHLDGEELKAIGAAPLIGEADGAVFRGGFADQTCALWSADGRLVANGVQATWYKE